MAKYVVVEEKVETQTEKRLRIFIAVLYFIQVLLLPLPLMHGTPVMLAVEQKTTRSSGR